MYVTFPVEWRFGESPSDGDGGPAVDDAGTVYVTRDESIEDDWPNGDYEAPLVAVKTSLTEMVDYCLDGWRGGQFTGNDHIPASDALAAALRSAADRLDAAKRPTSA